MSLHEKLLAWYDQNRRILPWRASQGNPDPYQVLISEIMLQQTTVATVIPYFTSFLQKWPTLQDLARAHLDEVLHAWQGLGYYSRARNLHKCAQILQVHYKGIFPKTPEALIMLPGIGPYTSKAIAAIGFNHPSIPIDGNVKRVLSRIYATHESVEPWAKQLESSHRPSDFAQALMELGALVCTPQTPSCHKCPWQQMCRAFQDQAISSYPAPKIKKVKPIRFATAYVMITYEGKIALKRRPNKGLLADMMEVPTSLWEEKPKKEIPPPLPTPAPWTALPLKVRHIFTHFHFEAQVKIARVGQELKGYTWVKKEDLHLYALPTVMKKIIACIPDFNDT